MTPDPIICPSLLGSLCLSVCLSALLLKLISREIWVGFGWNLVKVLELRSDWLYKNFVVLRRTGFAQRAKRVIGQRGNFFFFAFLCVSEHFESIETHFFSKIFVSAKRKTRASVLVRRIVSKFHKKIIQSLFFRYCVYCERLWLLRPSNLVCIVYLVLIKGDLVTQLDFQLY